MQESNSDTKRVAKNTLLLYIRMIVLMLIGLFTSRVILQVLGVEDFGINSAIAGFISMFGIITGSMSNAISRFITVELGRGKLDRLKLVYCSTVNDVIIRLISGGLTKSDKKDNHTAEMQDI